MVQQIAIIREGGLCAFNRSYWQLDTNPELLGGFIAALSEFVRYSFGFELEEFKCQDYRTFISRFDNNDVVLITVDDRDETYEALSSQTNLLAQQIWDKFSKKCEENEGSDTFNASFIEQLGNEIDSLIGRGGVTLESFSDKIFEDMFEGKIDASSAITKLLQEFSKTQEET
jgi:hypothetical protein